MALRVQGACATEVAMGYILLSYSYQAELLGESGVPQPPQRSTLAGGGEAEVRACASSPPWRSLSTWESFGPWTPALRPQEIQQPRRGRCALPAGLGHACPLVHTWPAAQGGGGASLGSVLSLKLLTSSRFSLALTFLTPKQLCEGTSFPTLQTPVLGLLAHLSPVWVSAGFVGVLS